MQKNLYSKNSNVNNFCRIPDTVLTCIWIDYLSIFAILKVVKFSRQDKGVHIYYIRANPIANILIKSIRVFFSFPIEMEKIIYSFGDMKFEKTTTGIRFSHSSMSLSQKILQEMRKKGIYHKLIAEEQKEKIDVFLEKIIYDEIYFIVRLLQIIEWKISNSSTKNRNFLLCPYSPLIEILKVVYQNSDIIIRPYNSLNYPATVIKNLSRNLILRVNFLKSIIISNDDPSSQSISIFTHLVHGIDDNRRSDIFWYPQSKIDPHRIFLFFDSFKSIAHINIFKICETIRKIGMHWICLDIKSILNLRNKLRGMKIRYIGRGFNRTKRPRFRIYTVLDRWMLLHYEYLMEKVAFWRRLFKVFNIKIFFDIGWVFPESVAQSIALDFTDGIRIGIQRSTMKTVENWPFARYNPNHLCFFWGEEAKQHRGTSAVLKNFIVSGFPFDRASRKTDSEGNLLTQLRSNNVKFIVALFDNVFKDDIAFSRNMMATFYHKFIEWLLEDEEVAIISKEKKPDFFHRLTEIQSLVSQVEKRGRFIRLNDARGRFPSDASRCADFAVGIGISSSVIEAVIGGCRGVLCDLAGHYPQPYYDWGYEKIIFDDIDRLISSLKRYKENPSDEPGLGDWSSYINILDPFRDGRSGERIGVYMRWLLESFERGSNRDQAIQYANKLYKEKWGQDKVIEIRHDYKTN